MSTSSFSSATEETITQSESVSEMSKQKEKPHEKKNFISRTTNLVSHDGTTALMLACIKNRAQDVAKLLEKKEEAIYDRTRTGKTAMHFCCEEGSHESLKILIAADPTIIGWQDEEGHSSLHLAVINGHQEIVRTLVRSGDRVDCLDNEKHSLVHWACVCGELDILEILLSKGAPASTPDIHGAHPIHYAAQMCGASKGSSSPLYFRGHGSKHSENSALGIEILKRLIEHGVSVDVRDQDGREPLLWASSAGSSEAILVLVNSGCAVHAEDNDGLTALHCAASRGHTSCIETLIGMCGAEVDVIDNNGCTALFYAVTLGHADSTELLLNYGAEPNRQDKRGRTPAHCGASKGQLETVKLLSKHGGNLWLRNVRGDLPLHEAVISGRKDLVLWLLSMRAETVNATNNEGRSPLHLASSYNHVEIVKILIDHRAEINGLMRSGKGASMTPLDAAISKGHSTIAKFLQLHGGLPSNSLNDSALQRRLNRSMDSRTSPSTTYRALTSNATPDPRHPFTSPDAFDTSLTQYSHNNSVHALYNRKETTVEHSGRFMATSTPINDDDTIINTSHSTSKDAEVQVSDEVVLNISADETTKQSKNSEVKKKSRRSCHKVPTSETASSSEDIEAADVKISKKSSSSTRKNFSKESKTEHFNEEKRKEPVMVNSSTCTEAVIIEEVVEEERKSSAKARNSATSSKSSSAPSKIRIGKNTSENFVEIQQKSVDPKVSEGEHQNKNKSMNESKFSKESTQDVPKVPDVEKPMKEKTDNNEQESRNNDTLTEPEKNSSSQLPRSHKPAALIADERKANFRGENLESHGKEEKSSEVANINSKSDDESIETTSKTSTRVFETTSTTTTSTTSTDSSTHKTTKVETKEDKTVKEEKSSSKPPSASKKRTSSGKQESVIKTISKEIVTKNDAIVKADLESSSDQFDIVEAKTVVKTRKSSTHEEKVVEHGYNETSEEEIGKEEDGFGTEQLPPSKSVEPDQKTKDESSDCILPPGEKTSVEKKGDAIVDDAATSKIKNRNAQTPVSETDDANLLISTIDGAEGTASIVDAAPSSQAAAEAINQVPDSILNRDEMSEKLVMNKEQANFRSSRKSSAKGSSSKPSSGKKVTIKDKKTEEVLTHDEQIESKNLAKEKRNSSTKRKPRPESGNIKSYSPRPKSGSNSTLPKNVTKDVKNDISAEENSMTSCTGKNKSEKLCVLTKEKNVTGSNSELNKSQGGSELNEELKQPQISSETLEESSEDYMAEKKMSVHENKIEFSFGSSTRPVTPIPLEQLSDQRKTEDQLTLSGKPVEKNDEEIKVQNRSSNKSPDRGLQNDKKSDTRNDAETKEEHLNEKTNSNRFDELDGEIIADEIAAGKFINIQAAAAQRKPRNGNRKNNQVSKNANRSSNYSKSEEREIELQEQLISIKKEGSSSKTSYISKKTNRKSQLSTITQHTSGSSISSRENLSCDDGSKMKPLETLAFDSGYSDTLGAVVVPTKSTPQHGNKELLHQITQNVEISEKKNKVISENRNGQSNVKRKSIFSSSAKKPPATRSSRKRHGRNEKYDSLSSRNNSVTSEELIESYLGNYERKDRYHPGRSNNSKGFKETQYLVKPKHVIPNTNITTPISVTQAMQASMRKYNLERSIFQQLLELKRVQMRASKSNEQILVKRMADGYKKTGLRSNFKDYDGPYSFKNFEKYLYDQLKFLQANKRTLPRFAPSDDIEKLNVALKKMNATKLPFMEDERSDEMSSRASHQNCSQKTHRCHHAAHAYTGVPCAAYIGKGKKSSFLPKVNPVKRPGPLQRDGVPRAYSSNDVDVNPSAMQISISPRRDMESPITLEVQQGEKMQVFNLPTKSLDPDKNYYVSLSIKPSRSPSPTKIMIEPGRYESMNSIQNHVPNVMDEDDGSISAPPVDTVDLNIENDINDYDDRGFVSNRSRHNVSL